MLFQNNFKFKVYAKQLIVYFPASLPYNKFLIHAGLMLTCQTF